jgi:hypothetical protein
MVKWMLGVHLVLELHRGRWTVARGIWIEWGNSSVAPLDE